MGRDPGVVHAPMGRLADIRAQADEWRAVREMRRSLGPSGPGLTHQVRARSSSAGAPRSRSAQVPGRPARPNVCTPEQHEQIQAWAVRNPHRPPPPRPAPGYFRRLMNSLFPFGLRRSRKPIQDEDSVTDECDYNIQTRNIRETHHIRLHTAQQAVRRQAFEEFVQKKAEEREKQERLLSIEKARLEEKEFREEYEKNRFRAREYHPVEKPFIPQKSKKPLTVGKTPNLSALARMKRSLGFGAAE